MKTKNMRKFLAAPGNVTDERLAAMYAHCQDGKLAFLSCCCFVGCATAEHSLRGMNFIPMGNFMINTEGEKYVSSRHLYQAKTLPFAEAAEQEFYNLGGDRFLFWIRKPGIDMRKRDREDVLKRNREDELRRRRTLPILRREMERRARMRLAFKPEFIEMIFEKAEKKDRAKSAAATD